MTSLSCYFRIENRFLKNMFAHNLFISKPIFKSFVEHIKTNLVSLIKKKILPYNSYILLTACTSY